MKSNTFTLIGMTSHQMTREQLTAILTATHDTHGLYLDDKQYLDWSAREHGRIVFEVGDVDENAVQVVITRAELETLVHRLAATLLAS